MTISVICPKCETKLKAAISSAGKSATCPKCKSTIIISQLEEPLLTIDDSPETQPIRKPAVLATVTKNIATKNEKKRINCDGYLLSYDSKIFTVKNEKEELRFPLRTQMAISYTHKADPFRVFVRVFTMVWLFPVTNFCFLTGTSANKGPGYIIAFAIFSIILLGMICLLIRDFAVYGLHTKGPLVVGIRIGGETNKFVFKKDRETARNFFQQVENFANQLS